MVLGCIEARSGLYVRFSPFGLFVEVAGCRSGRPEDLKEASGRPCFSPDRGAWYCRRQPFIEDGLHLIDGLEPGPSAFGAEVLIEHGAMEVFDDAFGLRSPDFGRPVLNLLELQKEFIKVLIRPVAELAAVARENAVDLAAIGLECKDDIIVEDAYGGDRKA